MKKSNDLSSSRISFGQEQSYNKLTKAVTVTWPKRIYMSILEYTYVQYAKKSYVTFKGVKIAVK